MSGIDPDARNYLLGMFAQFGDAAEARDGARGREILAHIAAEFDPGVVQYFMEGLVERSLANLAARIEAGEQEALETAARLLAGVAGMNPGR